MMALLVLFFALCQVGFGRTLPSDPALPQVYIDTTYPAVTGRSIMVNSGGDLQAAINAASPGDEIVLQAGATWTGNYTLPANGGAGWVVIRSSGLSALPSGARVGPSQALSMAKIQSPNSAPAFTTAASASYYWLAGLEITVASSVTTNYGLVNFGTGSETQAQLPSYEVVDRSWVHGTPVCGCKRGVQLNGATQAVIDSYISDIHVVGQDTQAICGWNGPGPFKIVNNYLEAAGENVMWGGTDPAIPNLVSSDIEFRQNSVNKPLSWNPSDPSYAGTHWSVKNLYESKNSQRVLIDGNIFTNCWYDAQTGNAILLKSTNQSGGCTWCITRDQTFTNNVISGAVQGIYMAGYQGKPQPPNARRIKISNVLICNPIRFRSQEADSLVILNSMQDLQITHLTAFGPYRMIVMDNNAQNNSPFLFRDNIIEHGVYGFTGTGVGDGTATLNADFSPWTWDHVMLLNTTAGTSQAVSNAVLAARYPTGTMAVTGYAGAGFLDYGSMDYHDYALSPSSLGRGMASDGKALGVDVSALEAAMTGSRTRRPPIRELSHLTGSHR
jgi:hypothetical protein